MNNVFFIFVLLCLVDLTIVLTGIKNQSMGKIIWIAIVIDAIIIILVGIAGYFAH
jgi:hypothetical protein